MPNVPYPYEVNWQIGHGKWFLNPKGGGGVQNDPMGF